MRGRLKALPSVLTLVVAMLAAPGAALVEEPLERLGLGALGPPVAEPVDEALDPTLLTTEPLVDPVTGRVLDGPGGPTAGVPLDGADDPLGDFGLTSADGRLRVEVTGPPLDAAVDLSLPPLLETTREPSDGATDPASGPGAAGPPAQDDGRDSRAAGDGSLLATGIVVGAPVAGLGLAGLLAGLRPAWSPRLAARLAGSGLKWLVALPVLGLFSRIRDDELVTHPVRAHLLEIMESRPGATMLELQEKAEVAWGTVVYHLERLEKARHVVSHRDGRHRRYWLEGHPEARMRQEASLLRGEVPRAIADAIASHPGLHQGAVCARLKLAAPTASKHLKRLAEAGLIRVEPQAKRRIYYPTDRLETVSSAAPC